MTVRQPGEFACPRCNAPKGQGCTDDYGRSRAQGEYCWARTKLAEKKTGEKASKPWE